MDAENILRVLLEGASLGSFLFHTHFQLNFYCEAGKKLGEKEIPREVHLSILSNWWFGDKEEWDKTVKKLTEGLDFIEPEEPVLEFKLAALRRIEGASIQSVKLTSEKLEIIFECGEIITILNNGEEDCAWELFNLDCDGNNHGWYVVCEGGDISSVMPRVLGKRKQYTNNLAVQIVQNGSNEEKADLAIGLGFDCPDYGFAQSMCIQLLQMDDEIIRGNAVIGLAHIARRFRKLDKRVVKPYLLRELRENVRCRDLTVNAINDINLYLGWNIGNKRS